MEEEYKTYGSCSIATMIASIVIDMLLHKTFLFSLAIKIWRITAGDYLKPYSILFFVLMSPYVVYLLVMGFAVAATLIYDASCW